MSVRTVSQVFGVDVADRLAALAIDLACAAPENPTTHMTRVPATLIQETREALEAAGVHWRKHVRSRIAAERERGARAQAERRLPK